MSRVGLSRRKALKGRGVGQNRVGDRKIGTGVEKMEEMSLRIIMSNRIK